MVSVYGVKRRNITATKIHCVRSFIHRWNEDEEEIQ
jgi:hypothetical protein